MGQLHRSIGSSHRVLVTQPFGSRAASSRDKRRVSLECYDEASLRGLGIAAQSPTVLGHEFWGVVEKVGANVTRFKRGDRVAIPFNHLHYTGGFGWYAKVTYAEINLVGWPEARDA